MLFLRTSKNNLLEGLVKLCVFLRTNSTTSDIWCALQDNDGWFHREKQKQNGLTIWQCLTLRSVKIFRVFKTLSFRNILLSNFFNYLTQFRLMSLI